MTDFLSIDDVERLSSGRTLQAPPEPFPGDPDATWHYWTDHDPYTIPDDWVWERLRNERDRRLTACDYRVVPDAPWDTGPWITYRQALRDLPDTTTDPRLAVWPTEPTEVKR